MTKTKKTNIAEQIKKELDLLQTSTNEEEEEDQQEEQDSPSLTQKEEEDSSSSSDLTLNVILENINGAYADIPFEISFFEMKKNFIASQIVPSRAYSTIGDNLFSYLNQYFNAKRSHYSIDCDIKEINRKLESDDLSNKEKSVCLLDLDCLMVDLYKVKHDINEYLQMISFLYGEFMRYPRISRQEFEDSEYEYFSKVTLKNAEDIRKNINLHSIELEGKLSKLIATKIDLVR